ncbi:hypothetical protein [Effusibacillus pohliae]|uniref:hypothetical protein n=1 Tax=Effusibacillus pohliae TaxID=232270 RepID=UPI000367AF5D|nr:hypothetical protein [Effusibacillus pohliae]
MAEYRLRCTVCGAMTEAKGTDVEELHAAKDKHVYICQVCQAKIKHESDQKYK